MFKKCFVAAVIVMTSSTFASAQDIFWSFSPTEVIPTYTSEFGSSSGSVYIFSDGLFGFDTLDLNFTMSIQNVIRFTEGEGFNPIFTSIGGTRFDSADVTIDPGGGSGNFFPISASQNGVDPALGPLFDPGFDSGVGPNGAVLLARVDFEVIGEGAVDLAFALGPQGAFQFPDTELNPTLGSAFFVTGLPPKLGYCIGDVNQSGTEENGFLDGVDFLDIAPFIALLASGEYQFEADCNFDESVDFLDIAPFIEILSGAANSN